MYGSKPFTGARQPTAASPRPVVTTGTSFAEELGVLRTHPAPRHGVERLPLEAKDGADLRLRQGTRLVEDRNVSKTGARSVGELAMTRRISAVAVCCSSDSVRAS